MSDLDDLVHPDGFCEPPIEVDEETASDWYCIHCGCLVIGRADVSA